MPDIPRTRTELFNYAVRQFRLSVEDRELIEEYIEELEPGLTSYALTEGQDGLDDFMRVAEWLVRFIRRVRRPATTERDDLRVTTSSGDALAPDTSVESVRFLEGERGLLFELPDREAQRAAAFSIAVAGQSARMAEVRDFRARALGRLLTDEEVHHFRWAPSLGILPTAYLHQIGIPVLSPRAEGMLNIEHDVEGQRRRVTLHIEPPAVTIDRTIEGTAQHPLTERGPQWWGREVWPDSVLGELQLICQDLAKRNGWKENEAAWFVLTGHAPFVSPIQAQLHFSSHETLEGDEVRRAAVTLTVEPWVSADAVTQTYRHHQRILLGRYGEATFNNRRTDDRTVDVFRFVEQRRGMDGRTPPLRHLARTWNELHPDQPFRDLDKFGRAYHRARETILGLDLHQPKVAIDDGLTFIGAEELPT